MKVILGWGYTEGGARTSLLKLKLQEHNHNRGLKEQVVRSAPEEEHKAL